MMKRLAIPGRLKNAARAVAERHWAIVVLVGFAAALRYKLLLGVMPATGDHMIHLYKGWLMAEHIVPSGRITGWTHLSHVGYPAGVYYPIIGDLYLTVFRYLTFGLLSWEYTYSLAFFVILIFIPVAVYILARKVAGPTGSLAAGLFSLGDVGGWPQGGHISTVYWAVWPFILALSLAFVALRVFEPALARPLRTRPQALVGFSLMLGLCAIAHPMNVTFLAVAMPLFVVTFIALRRGEVRVRDVLARATIAAAAALALSAFWIVPWITTGRDWTLSWPAVGFGGRWASLPVMLEDLVENDLFHWFWEVPWVLGGVGIVIGLLSRRLWPMYLAVLLVILFVGTGLADNLGDSIIARKIQIERMAAFLKTLWFVLAGLTVDRVAALVLWGLPRLASRWWSETWEARLRAVRPVVGIILALVLVSVGWRNHFSQARLIGELGGETWKDIVEAEHWLGRQPRGPLDRVLYQPGKMCVSGSLSAPECNEVYHRHLFASGPLRTGLPKLRFGYEATAIFRNVSLAHMWPADSGIIKLFLTKPLALENLHVRWIVSLTEWPGRSDLTLVRRFGEVRIYSVKWGEEPPVRVVGGGRAKLVRWSDEEVAVDVEGAAPGSRLRFPIAYFYPWRAYHDGEEIPISRAGILPWVRQILITTPARDGRTVLRYERPVRERAANWVSFVAFLCCIAFLPVRRFVLRRRKRA
ncbi:MAG: hypothetical protein PHU25_16870 [Deltaproteobacteria bacterium]|nr:hypothetical protein [Deltaproteobacteria bacterium]